MNIYFIIIWVILFELREKDWIKIYNMEGKQS